MLDIRHRLRAGESVTALADELQLAAGTISKIKHQQTWRHVQ